MDRETVVVARGRYVLAEPQAFGKKTNRLAAAMRSGQPVFVFVSPRARG
jgi:hypothetical protein